ncbi:MAG: HPr kinase/phosphatase C-terminal domain-containing protein [Aestuariivita sp.]|nr:HPr kinase/phosphatase C-terminal domain-containing protein [Aestuariivita sp.]
MKEIFHASCVAAYNRAALIVGPSNSGKSSLALELIARGAVLVSDDRTVLSCESSSLIAKAPLEICGIIEARGVGLLRAENFGAAQVSLIVNLGRVEDERLPPIHYQTILGISLPVLFDVKVPYFPAAILQYLKEGLALEKY